jgi:putative transposase
LEADIQISMGPRGHPKGRALDNIFTERLWRTIKYEEVYLHDYQTPKQARTGLTAYFDFYNYRRPHQALDYLTPAEVFFANTSAISNGMAGVMSRINYLFNS